MASHTSTIRNLPTAHEITAQTHEGRLSPVDSVQRSPDAIAGLDGGIHAFREVWADRALQAAQELEQNGKLLGLPLVGVSFTLKENTALENLFIQQLTSAGATAAETTVNPQFYMWGTTTLSESAIDNLTLPGHILSGFSGGPAAAVATKIAPSAQGNDGMGSLRIPTACCGLSILKVTPGTVPRYVEDDDRYGTSVQGVLTVSSEDLRLIAKTLANGMMDVEDPAKTLPENLTISVDTITPIFGLRAMPEYVDTAQQAAGVFADEDFAAVKKDMPYPPNPLLMFAH